MSWFEPQRALSGASGKSLIKFAAIQETADLASHVACSWDLKLSVGHGRLERTGWFDTAYEFKQGAQVQARVDHLSWCERGWLVDGNDALTQEDLLLIGLIYQ